MMSQGGGATSSGFWVSSAFTSDAPSPGPSPPTWCKSRLSCFCFKESLQHLWVESSYIAIFLGAKIGFLPCACCLASPHKLSEHSSLNTQGSFKRKIVENDPWGNFSINLWKSRGCRFFHILQIITIDQLLLAHHLTRTWQAKVSFAICQQKSFILGLKLQSPLFSPGLHPCFQPGLEIIALWQRKEKHCIESWIT